MLGHRRQFHSQRFYGKRAHPNSVEPQGEDLPSGFALSLEGGDAAITVASPARHNQTWRLLLVGLLGSLAASGAAVGAFLWLINLPPTANCDNAATVTTDRAQLFCAQTAAESGNLDEVVVALDLVSGWSTEHPLYREVQPLIEQWSWAVLKAAEQDLRERGSLGEAQALVAHIPAHSPVFARAQETLGRWQGEWERGEAIVATAQTALQRQDWATASRQILALAELKNPHWRVEQVQALSRQIRRERRAQELLAEAVATAAPGGSDRLGAALRTASQIEAGTYARQQAQPYLNRWSDLLLKLGLDKWYAGDLTTAVALGRSAALNPDRAQGAQELIWLSQARQQAQQSLATWRTSPDQLPQLYRAMLLANRIPKGSPYYPQAQSSVTTWQRYLGDLARLQSAQAVAAVRHIDALKAAIGQAEAVPLGHPRRVQAQSLMAHWRQEVERLEDRPQMVEAHRLAEAKTPQGLQAAIQAANTIPLHRALRGEAQSWAYVWTNELQVMEDQPLLDRARSLAAEGNLHQAMAEASGVRPGRALYGQARAAIASWQWQIAAAEQARLRAQQRAAAPRPSEPPAAPAVEAEAPLPPPDPLTETPPAAPAVQPLDLRLRRSPLPDRIDTVPGPAAPPVPMPAPAVVAPDPEVPAAELPPPTAPQPIPAAAPELAPVVPPTPPSLEVAPPGVTPPIDDLQSQPPAAPAVSAQPQPEAVISPALKPAAVARGES